MNDYTKILEAVRSTPEANQQLACAMVYVDYGHWDLVRLHAAAAADLLVAKDPALGDPIRLCALLVAAFLQDERNRAAAPLN